MSCCGCASRVLKLQSEMRSWKTKLADEKREKKMILRWIMAVFGYDVKVDIDKETHGIRLEASENKEGVGKALIKLGLGTETSPGTMVMELKLEDHEYYEPFEEPHDIPEFPILEINSMSSQQAPVVNTGISTLGHITQHPHPHVVPTLSITTPIEVTSTPLPISSGVEQDGVVYIAGNFENGATLEGLNGQSYIIVRANDNEEMPMQLDYALNDTGIVDGNNLFFRTSVPQIIETPNAINYLSATTKNIPPIQLSLPTVVTPAPVTLTGQSIVPETVIEELQTSVFKPSSANAPGKKKISLSSAKQLSNSDDMPSSKKPRTIIGDIKKVKQAVNTAQLGNPATKPVKSASSHKSKKFPQPLLLQRQDVIPPRLEGSSFAQSSASTADFGFKQKPEMYMIQNANNAVGK